VPEVKTFHRGKEEENDRAAVRVETRSLTGFQVHGWSA
jgi:hypothetical protein